MKRWKHMTVLILTVLLAAGLMKGIPLLAADNTDVTTVQVTGTYGQTEARQMLSLINEFRASGEAWYWNENDTEKVTCGQLDSLTYDYELERIAMQRAMEIAIYYSHTRPNGTDCFTLHTVRSAWAENIAAGYRTYEDVFVGWREDNEKYEGQGHRRNMLSENCKAIGIGHVVYNGIHYWVQEFSSDIQDTDVKEANDSEKTMAIDILSSNIIEKNIAVTPSSCSVEYGKTIALPTAQLQIKTAQGWPGGFMPVNVTPTYAIQDTSCASIVNGNRIQGLKTGTTYLNISAQGITKKISLTVTPVSLQNAVVTLTGNTFTYDGNEKRPSVQSVTVNGMTVGSENYLISYQNNIDAGTGKVVVTGIGNYAGTAEAIFTINPSDINNSDNSGNLNASPAVGNTIVSSDQATTYKVTGEATVEYTKNASARKKAKVTIPSTVTYGGQTYQVTSVAAKAFRNNKKLKKVVIPSTVRKIGKQAFINCKKLKSITIKTNKLTAKSVGSKAFKGINPKATIKVPKKKLKLYRKIPRMKGVSGSMKIK